MRTHHELAALEVALVVYWPVFEQAGSEDERLDLQLAFLRGVDRVTARWDRDLAADMEAYELEKATLAPGDIMGHRRLLARFRLAHGGRRVPDPPFSDRVDGGLLPVPPSLR